MTNSAFSKDFVGQENESPYFIRRQEADDYLEERVKRNVQTAVDASTQLQVTSAGIRASNRNFTNESANSVSGTADDVDINHIVPPIQDLVFQSHHVQSKPTLTPTAEWEGYVESISDDEFFVVMTNVRSASSLPTDQAVFSKDDVNEYERSLLREGAILRWIIGRERLPTGQVRKVSELYFRRLPAHTEADYLRAFHKAESLLDEVAWDEGA